MRRRRMLTALFAAWSLAAGGAFAAEEGGKQGGQARKPRRARPKPTATARGVVKTVDAEGKTLTITVKGKEDQSFTLTKKSRIIFRGPILDGVKAGDRVFVRVFEKEGEEKTIQVIVSRGAPKKGYRAMRRRPRGEGGRKKKPEGEGKGADGGDGF